MPVKIINGGLQKKVPVFIGIDQSLTGFSITALSSVEPSEHFTQVYKSPYFGIERLVDIRKWLEEQFAVGTSNATAAFAGWWMKNLKSTINDTLASITTTTTSNQWLTGRYVFIP